MNKLAYLLSRIWATFAYNFAPFLVSRSVAKRKGYCNECGLCCGNCPYLKDNKCSVYNNRPNWCHKDFPITKFERNYVADKDCSYYWDKK